MRAYIPLQARQEAAERQHGICVVCGLVITGSCELDHAVPLCLGGSNEVENLQWLHVACHKKKTSRDVTMKAKADRIARKRNGTWKRKGRKMQSRGFDKTVSRKMNGTVVRL